MTKPSIDYSVIHTGGAVRLDITSAASGFTLERSINGSGTWTTLYSGAYVPMWLDVGDQLPGPLSADSAYLYRVTDTYGTYETSAITASGAISIQEDHFTHIFIRLMTAGIASLAVPADYRKAKVIHSMPLMGIPRMPFVTINLDLIQQAYVKIGEQIPQPDLTSEWTITRQARRRYSINVLTENVDEREFYRDAILAIFPTVLADPLLWLGQNVEHDFQAVNGQWEQDGDVPGAYFSEISLEFVGPYNLSVNTGVGVVNVINATASGATNTNQTTTTVQVSG